MTVLWTQLGAQGHSRRNCWNKRARHVLPALCHPKGAGAFLPLVTTFPAWPGESTKSSDSAGKNLLELGQVT